MALRSQEQNSWWGVGRGGKRLSINQAAAALWTGQRAFYLLSCIAILPSLLFATLYSPPFPIIWWHILLFINMAVRYIGARPTFEFTGGFAWKIHHVIFVLPDHKFFRQCMWIIQFYLLLLNYFIEFSIHSFIAFQLFTLLILQLLWKSMQFKTDCILISMKSDEQIVLFQNKCSRFCFLWYNWAKSSLVYKIQDKNSKSNNSRVVISTLSPVLWVCSWGQFLRASL